jgi:hypothetical protein
MQEFNSFAELARVHGSTVKAQEKLAHGSYITVEDNCGKKAAIIWSILTERECTKAYGENGKLILSLDELCKITGYNESSVIGCVVNLIRNNYARPTSDGKGVKAA